MKTGIEPHTRAWLTIDGLEYPTENIEAYLTLTFTLREATSWAPKGHEVALGQLRLQPKIDHTRWQEFINVPKEPKGLALLEQTSVSELTISGEEGARWVFDLTVGSITSWARAGSSTNIITEPLSFEIYRALTDNDRLGEFGPQWKKARVHQARCYVVRSSWETIKEGDEAGIAKVFVVSRIAPPVLNWSVTAETTYKFSGKEVSIHVNAKIEGALKPATLPRFGLKFGLAGVDKVSWFGRGPGESYRDRKLSQRFGNWTLPVDDLFVDYDYPQDNGNRTDVKWVEFLGKAQEKSDDTVGDRLLRARFDNRDNYSFQALAYTTADLDAANHPYELAPLRRNDTIVHLDWRHHGLGTGSCGPSTFCKHQLLTKEGFRVSIVLD